MLISEIMHKNHVIFASDVYSFLLFFAILFLVVIETTRFPKNNWLNTLC